eukprot:1855482-Prymnesium_polylepis.1
MPECGRRVPRRPAWRPLRACVVDGAPSAPSDLLRAPLPSVAPRLGSTGSSGRAPSLSSSTRVAALSRGACRAWASRWSLASAVTRSTAPTSSTASSTSTRTRRPRVRRLPSRCARAAATTRAAS